MRLLSSAICAEADSQARWWGHCSGCVLNCSLLWIDVFGNGMFTLLSTLFLLALEYCGSRTDQCPHCQAWVPLRNMDIHICAPPPQSRAVAGDRNSALDVARSQYRSRLGRSLGLLDDDNLGSGGGDGRGRDGDDDFLNSPTVFDVSNDAELARLLEMAEIRNYQQEQQPAVSPLSFLRGRAARNEEDSDERKFRSRSAAPASTLRSSPSKRSDPSDFAGIRTSTTTSRIGPRTTTTTSSSSTTTARPVAPAPDYSVVGSHLFSWEREHPPGASSSSVSRSHATRTTQSLFHRSPNRARQKSSFFLHLIIVIIESSKSRRGRSPGIEQCEKILRSDTIRSTTRGQ